MGIKNSQKVLVTGGAGYLGARVGSSLAAQGYDVFLGSRNPFKNGSIDGCEQVYTDWKHPDLNFCKGYDLIIHAAGMNARACADDPEMAHRFNGLLTEKLIEKALAFGCKRFFYLSTVHVYDAPLIGCFNESSLTLNKHPYATSHFYGEQALKKALATGALRGAVLRLSNCFGFPITSTRDSWGLVVNEFVRDAVSKQEIIINGNYLSKRDFLPIAELNKILAEVLNYSDTLPSIINISSGKSMTLGEVADIVSRITSQVIGEKVSILKNINSAPEGDLLIDNNALKGMGISVGRNLNGEIRDLISNAIKTFKPLQ
ncbi:SDR family oxidoreductase [Gammaproteobacteria bacterium]|nr:SDR family oxidoreductase [Gammaproteobacteria bacterium]